MLVTEQLFFSTLVLMIDTNRQSVTTKFRIGLNFENVILIQQCSDGLQFEVTTHMLPTATVISNLYIILASASETDQLTPVAYVVVPSYNRNFIIQKISINL